MTTEQTIDAASATATPATAALYAIAFSAIVILVAGLVLLWRWQFSRKSFQYKVPRVPVISVPWIYFVGMVLFVGFAWIITLKVCGVLCQWLFPDFPLNTGYAEVVFSGVGNIGAIAAALYARRFLLVLQTMPHIAVKTIGMAKPPPPISIPMALAVGAGVFCVIRTVLVPVMLGWDWLLNLAGVAAADQDMVVMLRGEGSSVHIAVMTFIAVVLAPIMEEMIFRGALFGYCRIRMPRWLAVLLPSLVFAAIHMDKATGLPNARSFMPLFALAIILSIAYERTGRIAVPIVAHALLNLSTIGMILLGVDG